MPLDASHQSQSSQSSSAISAAASAASAASSTTNPKASPISAGGVGGSPGGGGGVGVASSKNQSIRSGLIKIVSAPSPTPASSLRLYRSRSNTDSDLQQNLSGRQPRQQQLYQQQLSVGGARRSLLPSSVGGGGSHPTGSMLEAGMQPPLLRSQASHDGGASASTILPSQVKRRLYELFSLIEKEFESMYAENLALNAKVEALTERLTEGGALPPDKAAEILEISAADMIIGGTSMLKSTSAKKASQVGQKLKTAFRVVPGPGRNLVSSFKANVQLGGGGGDASRVRYVQSYVGHRDGIWHVVATPFHGAPGHQYVLGTASADQTARVWCLETGAPLLVYVGHTGSVNGISFYAQPSAGGMLAATASGDQSAHVWKVTLPNLLSASTTQQPQHSSEDELDVSAAERAGQSADDQTGDENEPHCGTLRTPLVRLTGHTSAVIAVDWLFGGDQVITASWDRTANIYDLERGEILNVLTGHDQELNHCSAHLSRKLVVTSSKDSTFRLWDFRDPIYSVAVFQGHNDSVTSTVFSSGDKVVSGSDDRTVKVWDLRNMRTALATIRTDSAVNRLSLSHANSIIAIPHDNRNVRLYDLNGNRLGRLPRSSRRGHRRMVCCTAWADDSPHCNLFTCGFDKQLLGWKVATQIGKGEKD